MTKKDLKDFLLGVPMWVFLIILLGVAGRMDEQDATPSTTTEEVTTTETRVYPEYKLIDIEDVTTEKYENEEQASYDDAELQLLARVVYAEAGNQDEIGKRLVIDCVLNRVDSSRFPNSITKVLYQQGQFTTVYSASNYPMQEYIYDLILEEQVSRYNDEVLFFRTSHYHDFGTPVIQHQAHYFSK